FNLKYYGDQPAKGEGTDGFLLGRLRLGMDYRPTENIHVAVWGQHADVWDLGFKESDFYNSTCDQEHNPYKDHRELYNTYLEVRQILDQPLSMKAGRQIISYGNKRIFGPGQWGNSGKWIWDAVKLSYKFGDGFVDAYYGRTMLHDPEQFSLNHAHGFESYGLYSRFKLPQGLLGIAAEPFFFTRENDRDRYKCEDGQWGNFDSYYLGCRIFKMNLNGFDSDLTFVKQEGDFANDDIDAYGYHFLLAYNFGQLDFKPRIGFEYSYASGDSDPNDGEKETFDGAFGARDKMYGRMNLFHWKNLKDAQVNLEIKPKKGLYLKAEYHQFWLAEKEDAWYLNSREYRDKTGNSGDKVGKEFDLVGRLKLPWGNEIQLGYGHFWPDEFAENLASDKEADWVFLQWTYDFSYGVI
ncbi:MAG: alginate export family protein, partial [Deltaproteobacteria bacterium]|nr:alginate export family protein [Deltaproteobacteria bacterium]